MTTLVETGEEDPAVAVARFTAELAWAPAGPELQQENAANIVDVASGYLADRRWPELASLLLTSSEMVLTNASEKDSECVFTVISNLVAKAEVESPENALLMAEEIAGKVTANTADKPALRLRILFNLYNVLEMPYGRFVIYKRALDFAATAKVTELITPTFKRMDSYLNEWSIGPSEKRKLYLAVTNILKDGRSSKDSFNFLLKYLLTFDNEDAQTLEEALGEAKRAAVEFIKSPDMFHSDLLEMSAIRQLETKCAPLYRLLEIFLTSRLDAYLEFQAANPQVLKDYGLVHEDCIAKMRLMSLAGLASRATGGEISYSTIKEALKVGDDEVEYWIVKGIASKMLDGKMDQMNEMVVISRSTSRVFGSSEWRELRAKVAVWKENMLNVTRTIETAKSHNGVPVALQAVH